LVAVNVAVKEPVPPVLIDPADTQFVGAEMFVEYSRA
jgi:hypothetical protein